MGAEPESFTSRQLPSFPVAPATGTRPPAPQAGAFRAHLGRARPRLLKRGVRTWKEPHRTSIHQFRLTPSKSQGSVALARRKVRNGCRMLDHPLSVSGWIVAAIGFAALVFWVPTAAPTSGFGAAGTVFNMHKAEISWAVMATGFVMVIVGTIAGGFDSLQRTLRENHEPTAAPRPSQVENDGVNDNVAPASPTPSSEAAAPEYREGDPPNFNLLKKTHLVRLNFFNSIEIHEMPDGLFIMHDGNKWRSFTSKEDAVKVATGMKKD